MAFVKSRFTATGKARLAKTEKKVREAGSASVRDITNLGKELARRYVPKGNTGWLYSQISSKIIATPSGDRGEVFLKRQIVPNDGIHRRRPTSKSNWKFISFNLVKWMHESPRAASHIRGGERRAKFMRTAREELKLRYGKIVRNTFSKLRI